MSAEVEMLNEELHRKRNHIKLLNAELQKKDAALKLALEALEYIKPKYRYNIEVRAIAAIKEAM